MNFAHRLLARSLPVVVLSVPAMQGVAAPDVAAECGTIQILSGTLSKREAETYCRYAVEERRKVEVFWGATWKETIRVHVDPSYRISRALVPGHLGNRGFVEMPLRGVRNDDGALLHEIVLSTRPTTTAFLPRVWPYTRIRSWRATGRFRTSAGRSIPKRAVDSRESSPSRDSTASERRRRWGPSCANRTPTFLPVRSSAS